MVGDPPAARIMLAQSLTVTKLVMHCTRGAALRTARSRGLPRGEILRRHVLKNALLPVITYLAVSAAEIMTSSIIVEQVFTIPGVGRLLLSSISNRDFPVVQAIVVILAAWIVVVNLVADVLYQLADPRIRLR